MTHPEATSLPFPVAVTAAASYSPAGRTLEELLSSVQSGRSGLGRIERIPDTEVVVPFTATVGSLGEDLPEAEERGPFCDNRQLRVGWAALRQMQSEVTAAVRRHGGERVGLVIGTSTGGVCFSEWALRQRAEQGRLPQVYDCVQGHAMDAWGRHAAIRLGIQGPVYAVSTACTSGAKALASARRLVQLGLCDAVLAGGVDSLCQMTVFGFHSLGVLSEDVCRPFDASGYGMNVAEGASLLLIERVTPETAPSAVVLCGVGESSDAHHMSAPDPTGGGQARAMRAALEDARALPKRVFYVNAHGTGTQANDEAEALAIAQLELTARVSSTKGLCGHQLGSAGATEALIARGLLEHATESGAEAFRLAASGQLQAGPEVVPHAPVVLSNSFAFGGSNVCLAFSRLGELAADSTATAAPAFVPSEEQSFAPRASAGLELVVEGCGVCSEGEVDATSALGAGVLPRRAHARASQLTRLGAELFKRLELTAEQAAKCALVVGSAMGQLGTTVDLIQKYMAGDSSPLAFQNSVHNAIAGALSVALENREASSSVAAGWASAEAALLEAALYLHARPDLERVVVLMADETPPEVLGLPDYRIAGCSFSLRRGAEEPRGASIDSGEAGSASSRELGRLCFTTAPTGRDWNSFSTTPTAHPLAPGLALARWFQQASGADAPELWLGSVRIEAKSI